MNLMRFFHASTCSIKRYDQLLTSFMYANRPASCVKAVNLGRFRGSPWGVIARAAQLLRFFRTGCVYAALRASYSLVIIDP